MRGLLIYACHGANLSDEPAMQTEDTRRGADELSPVGRHPGPCSPVPLDHSMGALERDVALADDFRGS